MSRRIFRLTFLLLFLAHCAPTPSTIRQDQAPEKVQAKAAAEFKVAEKLFQENHMAQALIQYQMVAKTYYNTTSADNALLRIAQIYKREKNYKVAEDTLKRLVGLYPLSDVRYQALRELAAMSIQNAQYDDALNYLIEIDLKKLPPKDQNALNSAAVNCIKKTNRSDLALLWKINWTDADPSPNLQSDIRNQISASTNKELLERIMTLRKNQFPALEAAIQRYNIAQQNHEETKKWSAFIVENFPTSAEAERFRVQISEPIPFQAGSGGPYNIGVLLPLSGEQQSYGNQVLNGIKTAIETIKEANPSQQIQLFVQDIGPGGDAARQGLQSMLVEHQIIAAIGPLNAKDTEAIAPLAQDNNLPVLSLSPAENVTTYGSTIFRNSITKSEQAVGLAQFATQTMGIHRLAILYPNNSYGKEFMQLFWGEVEKRGGEIRGAEEYDRNASDFETPIKRLVGLSQKEIRKNEICSKNRADEWMQNKKTGAPLPSCYPADQLPPIVDFEAIFVPDSYDKARQILPTLLFHDVKGVQVLGTNLWNTDELLAGSIGNEMEGALFLDGFYKSTIGGS